MNINNGPYVHGTPIHTKIPELWCLARHHEEILKRRFPSYRCDVCESTHELTVVLDVKIRTHTNSVSPLILEVIASNSIEILIYVWGSITDDRKFIPINGKIMDYADPKFTDNFLSDILKE